MCLEYLGIYRTKYQTFILHKKVLATIRMCNIRKSSQRLRTFMGPSSVMRINARVNAINNNKNKYKSIS